jgi:hypothetical protein
MEQGDRGESQGTFCAPGGGKEMIKQKSGKIINLSSYGG